MDSHADTAEFINVLCTGTPDLTTPKRALVFDCLVQTARDCRLALEIVRGIYYLAASGRWKPSPGDLSTLVYAPMRNPDIIADIGPYIDEILNSYPDQDLLRSGWRYVQLFSCDPYLPHPRGLPCYD